MNEISEPEIDIEGLKTKIREAAARRDINTQNLTSSSSIAAYNFLRAKDLNSVQLNPSAMLKVPPEFQPAANDRYHVNDLLKYQDKEFVRNAYRAVLKREPDRAGEEHQLKKLRSGRFDKIDILAGLRASPEGKQRGVHLEGLFWPALVRRLHHLPIVGYPIQLAIAIFRLPVLIRYYRESEAYLLAQQGEILERIKDLAEEARQQQQITSQQQQQIIAEQQQQITAGDKKVRDEVHGWLVTAHEELKQQSQALTQEVEERVKRITRSQQQTRTELVLQERRISVLLEEARRRLPAPFGEEQLQVLAYEANHMLDQLYTLLQDEFRGTREDIKERSRTYLPFLQKAGITTDILDIGCGRGEWLEVLEEAGLQARGVDTNRVMLEQCRERGFDVAESEAISYLRSLPDGSLRAVTCFHLVEHLPFEALIKFLDEIIRVLKPGGVLMVETPNPENVVVGSCNFYLDPTHHHPLPSSMMQFILEARGLCRVEIIKLHSVETDKVRGVDELTARFNTFFYGHMDYAAIGWKI